MNNSRGFVEQLWSEYRQKFAASKMAMLKSGQLTLNGKTMNFVYNTKGQRPPQGYILIFGLHGGGGCPAETNNQQYNNHKHLYEAQLPKGSVWFTPRSCEDSWDMWFQDYMEDFLFEIIRAFVLNDIVDINRVFITGYSAGGDGVYHLAPRMADHLAGAAMMAGHPNGINLMNIRNIPFSIQCGSLDNAYNRHYEAVKYIRMVNQLAENYGGFQQRSKIHEGKPHWMGKQESQVFDWLFSFERNPYPDTILYKQCPRRKKNLFYYLRFGDSQNDQQIVVKKQGNRFQILSNRAVTVLVSQNMVNPSQPITIVHNGKTTVQRNMQSRQDIMQKTFFQRLDPYYVFEDEFHSEPPTTINIKNAICSEFGIDMEEKEAEYEPSLPAGNLPPGFKMDTKPLVKRKKTVAPRHLQQHQNYDSEPQIIEYQQYGNNLQISPPPQQYNPNFQQPQPMDPNMKILARQQQPQQQTYQYGANPYNQTQQTQQRNGGQPIRCVDQCCRIF